MSDVQILSDNEMDQWDGFVESHEAGSLFHTSLWRNVIRKVFGCEPAYFAIMEDAGAIKAGLPAFVIKNRLTGARIVSLPNAQYCNPLVSSQLEYDSLIDAVQRLMDKSGIKYFELKTSQSFASRHPRLVQSDAYYFDYVLDIDRPLETIMGSFHKSCIQRILKNIDKSELKLRQAETVDDVGVFCRLHETMRKEKGLLPLPRDFFFTMWDVLAPRGHMEILFAEHRQRIVSAALFLFYKDTVYYDYAATDQGMLSLHPSHFLIWTGIRRAHELGYRRFDFGRTTNDNTGLSEFKERWGTTCEALNYYYMPDMRGAARMRRENLMKKMMNVVIRISPEAFCRVMGELLYRRLV